MQLPCDATPFSLDQLLDQLPPLVIHTNIPEKQELAGRAPSGERISFVREQSPFGLGTQVNYVLRVMMPDASPFSYREFYDRNATAPTARHGHPVLKSIFDAYFEDALKRVS